MARKRKQRKQTSAPGPPPAPEEAGRSRLPWLFLALLILVGVLSYSNSYQGAFLFDDHYTVDPEEVPQLGRLWPKEGSLRDKLDHLWEAGYVGRIGAPTSTRVVANLSMHLNYMLANPLQAQGGQVPFREINRWGFHFFNHLVHLFTGVLLFAVLRQTLRRVEAFAEWTDALSFAVAVLWIAHPLNSSAVTYISQRCESLMGLWLLLSFYAGLRAVDAVGRKRTGWNVACFFACLLAVNTKEIGAFIPGFLFFWDRAFVFGTWREAFARRGRLYGALALNWGFIVIQLAQGSKGNTVGFTHSEITSWLYAKTQAVALVDYLRLVFWPDPLLLDHGWPLVYEFKEYAPAGALILVLVGLSLFALYRWPRVGFAGTCFFVILAPTSSFLPILSEIKAEHRMYLPSAVVIALVVLGLARAARRFGVHGRPARAVGGLLLAAAVVALVLKTRWQNRLYDSEIKMWTYNAQFTPNNRRVFYNLGQEYSNQDDYPRAIQYYREALRCSYDYPVAMGNLGIVLYKAGRYAEAQEQLERVITFEPDKVSHFHTLGVVYVHLNRPDLAYRTFQRALELAVDPIDQEKAQKNMVFLCVLDNRFDEALQFMAQWTGAPLGHPLHIRYLAQVAGDQNRPAVARQLLERAAAIEKGAAPQNETRPKAPPSGFRNAPP